MTLYLIAHKVRGEPAFDIATRMDVAIADTSETWWIIPTSGHRAYPFWNAPINPEAWTIPPMPADLPDHYPVWDDKPTRSVRPPIRSAIPTLEDL